MKQIDTSHCLMKLDDDLLRVYFKPGKIDLAEAKQVVSDRQAFIGDVNVYMLVYDEGVTNISRAARNYFASKNGTSGVEAGAFLIQRPLTKIMVNYLLKVSRPNKPAKMFTDESKALEWLAKQKELDAVE